MKTKLILFSLVTILFTTCTIDETDSGNAQFSETEKTKLYQLANKYGVKFRIRDKEKNSPQKASMKEAEEFNLPTTNGGHATAKNNVSGKQAYNYIRFTPTARRDKDPLDYTVAGSAWWNMSEIYLYRIRHDEAWAREQLGI